mmetsp:Transcript_18430/g.46164  ORF Transcript_18430/g.46164 Transcript_18430/m.46164 type:complete len:274 (+) Transcript_18430:480-1301(+)
MVSSGEWRWRSTGVRSHSSARITLYSTRSQPSSACPASRSASNPASSDGASAAKPSHISCVNSTSSSLRISPSLLASRCITGADGSETATNASLRKAFGPKRSQSSQPLRCDHHVRMPSDHQQREALYLLLCAARLGSTFSSRRRATLMCLTTSGISPPTPRPTASFVTRGATPRASSAFAGPIPDSTNSSKLPNTPPASTTPRRANQTAPPQSSTPTARPSSKSTRRTDARTTRTPAIAATDCASTRRDLPSAVKTVEGRPTVSPLWLNLAG